MVWYIAAGVYFWELFKLWLSTLFVVPFKHADMLWLLVPIWISWFFAEFFQEKHGTSMGNAITNSVVIIWGSIDCARQTVGFIADGVLVSFKDIFFRFFMIVLILVYGVTIVVLGLKGNKVIKYIGRVREVTYAFAIFTPVFYNAVPLTFNHVIAALLFFPVFYFAIELLDRYTPNPKAVVEDEEERGAKPSGSVSGFDSSGFGSGSDLGGFGDSKKGSGFDDLGSSGKKDDGLGDFKL